MHKLMSNKSKILDALVVILILISMLSTSVFAESAKNQHDLDEIEALVNDVMKKSNIPGASVAVIRGEQIDYLSYGFSDAKNSVKLDELSLFQIGSLTKAYTGLGILLLEDEGKLSLSDPVSKYIPWFTATYNGETVKSEDLTLADFLYQISGFTNDETKYPRPSEEMTLEDNLRNLNGKELAFAPSTQYAYANTNFNILGLVIEVVSGQSYEEFMTERILQPLGLNNTYVDSTKAEETGKVVNGRRLAFFQTYPFDLTILKGGIPAGYIISNATDMGRWLQIQMGTIKISPQFDRIIEKSHTPNKASIIDDNTLYASGWFVDEKSGVVYHSGGTPSFSTRAAMNPDKKIAVCVLTNINLSANTNYIGDNILNILENKPVTTCQNDIWYSIDSVFTVVTLACIFLLVLVVVLFASVRKQIKNNRREKTKTLGKRIVLLVLPLLLFLLSITTIVITPIIFSSSWIAMGLWAPYSLYSGVIVLTTFSLLFLFASILISRYPKKKI